MCTEEKEYTCITSYLKALNFHFSDNWILQSINNCKSTNPNISLEVLKKTLRQEWLLINLRNMKVPVLPPNLKSCEKTILHGRYAVQVESMIDCSKSYYSQLLNLQKIEIDVETTQDAKEINLKSDRCLIFVISDGVQELKAMEYKIIKKINMNDSMLLPGFKMIIIGPVECRKGMVLLKDENVQLCGGKIDALLTTNCLQSLLMQKLDITEEDIPSSNFKEQGNNQKMSPQTQSQKNIICENENVEALLSTNDDVFFSLPSDYESSKMTKKTNFNNNPSKNLLSFEESDQKNLDFFIFKNSNETEDKKTVKKRSLSIEDKFPSSSKKFSFSNKVDPFTYENTEIQNVTKINEIEDMCIDKDVFVTPNFSQHLNKKSVNEVELVNQSIKSVKKNESIKGPVQSKLSEFFKKNNLNDTSSLNQKTNEILNDKFKKPFLIDYNPFVYLKDIKALLLKTPTVFVVKCVVLTLKKKITIENDEFNLKATITDGSNSIDANFCSAIVENFLDYSPCEMEAMMKSRLTNSAINSQIKEAFNKAQEKFINLNCLMNIKFFPNEKTPEILSLEELTFEHFNALKKRSVNA